MRSGRRVQLKIQRIPEETRAYLGRIHYRGSTRPSLRVLRVLHKKHLLSIPFENLDIHLGRPIILDEDAFYDKIIRHRRGGFCYELNGSFAALLAEIGFKVRMLSARVAGKNGRFSPEFDHMTLLIQLKERWLVDVGFGDSFTEPKRLDYSGSQRDNGRIYRITGKAGERLLSKWNEEKSIRDPQYMFSLRPRRLRDFVRRCRYQQTSPNSHFRKSRLCSRLTPDGRVTLTDTKLIVTRGHTRSERPVKNQREFDKLLRRHFGVKLS